MNTLPTQLRLTLAFAALLPLGRLEAQSAANDEPVQLSPVYVQSTLRNEPALSIPVAVSVISGADMAAADLNDLSDIVEETPSLTFRAGGSNKDTSLLIRGVGTITTSPGVEPDVSTVIDGVVLARPGQATLDLLDVDHIEILRGPQGTLFGKNSSVGVINIVTTDPGDQTHGYLDADYFTGQSEELVRAGVSGAIVPHVLDASVSFIFHNYDGNVDNLYLGREVNGYRDEGVRTKLVYTPTADFKATVNVNYVHTFETTPNDGPVVADTNTAFPTGAVSHLAAAEAATQAGIVPGSNNQDVESGLWGRTYDENNGASATLEWNVDGYTLTSITAYQHWYNNQYEDTGLVPAPTVGQTVSWDSGYLWFDQYSQELRVTSPTGRFFDFVSGLYFQEAIDTETYNRSIVQEPAAGTLVDNAGSAHYGTHGGSYSAYGEGTWNLAPVFRIVTGVRLTRDLLDFYHQRISTSAVAVPGIQPSLPIHSGDTQANGFSGRVGAQLDVGKNSMLYATYSRGYKGPAYNVFFNQTALQVAPLDPETSDDYEVGFKTLSFNNRLQFTVDAFDTIYHNYQANFAELVVGTPVTNLINAGQVSSKGVEAEARARVTSGLTLTASAARINAVVDDFNTPAGTTNINGQPLPFAPRFKAEVSADQRLPLAAALDLDLETDYAWQTEQQFSLTETPDTIQPAYGIWNASIALLRPRNGWRVAVLVRNIADQHYADLLTEGGSFVWRIVPRDDDRYFGVAFERNF